MTQISDTKAPRRKRFFSAKVLGTSPTPSRRLSAARPLGKFHQYRGLFLLTIAVIFLFLIQSFVKPLVMGAIFACVLSPLMNQMKHWRIGRSLQAMLLTVVFFLVVMIPLGALIYLGVQAGIEQIAQLQTQITPAANGSINANSLLEIFGLQTWISRISNWLPIDAAQTHQLLLHGAQTAALFLSTTLQNILADVPGILLSTFVILTTLYYLLIDGHVAIEFVRKNSFFGPRETDHLITGLGAVCNSVVIASILSGLVQAFLVGFAVLVTGAHSMVFITLVTFMVSFVPLIGTAPVILFLIIRAFAHGETSAGIVFLVCAGLLVIADNFVRPYVLKGHAKIHPLIGFVAAFAALSAIGIYGLFIGPIVAGLFFQALPIFTRSYDVPAAGSQRIK